MTGVSGSGKSSLVSQALVELVARAPRPRPAPAEQDDEPESLAGGDPGAPTGGHIAEGMEPHPAAGARGPEADRAHAALEPRHLHRPVRRTCASCSPPRRRRRRRRYDAGRFSFNVAKGRCETCEGEGFVMVELLFLPSVYAPCRTCHGARYNAKTLEVA